MAEDDDDAVVYEASSSSSSWAAAAAAAVDRLGKMRSVMVVGFVQRGVWVRIFACSCCLLWFSFVLVRTTPHPCFVLSTLNASNWKATTATNNTNRAATSEQKSPSFATTPWRGFNGCRGGAARRSNPQRCRATTDRCRALYGFPDPAVGRYHPGRGELSHPLKIETNQVPAAHPACRRSESIARYSYATM